MGAGQSSIESIVDSPHSIDSLDQYATLQKGLIAVSFFGTLSFLSTFALLSIVTYRLVRWKRRSNARVNQFLILILNLIAADFQQSICFMLNIHWLRTNIIDAYSPVCFAQGWFDSTGDLASGTFTFAIAIHAFVDIVFDFRLSRKSFLGAIACLWCFVFLCAVIGVAMHPTSFYRRAGAWCWISSEYTNLRLSLHYIWVIIAEFGSVITYTALFFILRHRVKQSFYKGSDSASRARSAAKLIIAYPIVYVICTLPLVKTRLTSMAHRDVSFLELCIAGAFETSCGWLDVILYTTTRSTLLFGPELSDENIRALDTFRWQPENNFGTTTVIEATGPVRRGSRRRSRSRFDSTEELCAPQVVKAETVVNVKREMMNMEMLSLSPRSMEDATHLESSRRGSDSISEK